MKKQSKRVNGNATHSLKQVKSTKRPAAKSAVRTKAARNSHKLETKEERELAQLEALTLRAFQMAYDNHHSK